MQRQMYNKVEAVKKVDFFAAFVLLNFNFFVFSLNDVTSNKLFDKV